MWDTYCHAIYRATISSTTPTQQDINAYREQRNEHTYSLYKMTGLSLTSSTGTMAYGMFNE